MSIEIIISALLAEHTLEGKPYTYPFPQHFIGKEVYWKNEEPPEDWTKYIVAGITLEQSLNSDGTVNAVCQLPHWEYVLAEIGYLNPWKILENWYGHTKRPTCHELISVGEYEVLLSNWSSEEDSQITS